MKKIILLLNLVFAFYHVKSQVNFGTNTTNTDAVTQFVSADSSQGVMLPIVKLANRPTCNATNETMIIYNITDSVLQYCNGDVWVNLRPSLLQDLDQDTKVDVEEGADEDWIRFDTKGVERMVIDSLGNVGIGTNQPANRLHISDTLDPIRIEGLASAANLDTIITIDALGVLHKTDVNDLLDVNLGDILYVASTGNDSTAEKGNPNKPWRHILTARDSAVAGDVIYIFPHEITWGPIGSGADIEVNPSNRDSTSLFLKDSIIYYSMPGVVFKCIGGGGNIPLLFQESNPFVCKFLGHAKIKARTTASVSFIAIWNDTLELTLELDEVDFGNPSWPSFGTIGKCKSAIINIKRYNVDNGYFRIADYGAARTVDYPSYVKLTIDELRAYNADAVFDLNGGIDRHVEINISNFYLEQKYTSLSILNDWNNSSITYNIGDMMAVPTAVPGHSEIFYFSSLDFDSSTYTINIQNLDSKLKLFRSGFAAVSPSNGEMALNINKFIYSGTYADFFNPKTTYFNKITLNTDLTNNTNLRFGNIPNGIAKVHLSGTYNSNSLININGSNVYLKNAFLLNDGLSAPITSSSAQNINCMNTFTNSLIVDPNVTELIQPIIRDANVQ